MKTTDKPSTTSEKEDTSPGTSVGAVDENCFEPPGITDLASLTDGRKVGEFRSCYPRSAWIQIAVELAYLLTILLLCFAALVLLAKYTILDEKTGLVHSLLGDLPKSAPFVLWASVALSGAVGGCTSSLKWLYHSVAKQRWHRDRIIWRFVVPILSSMLATFLGLMIVSGIVPFLSKTPLTVPTTGAAFGFFVGIFSDSVLGALQKFAFRVFGTVDKGSTDKD